MRRTLRRLRTRAEPSSPWTSIVARGIPNRRGGGPRVLCATSVGGHPVARLVDSLVASALYLRDAEPTFLLCDAALPACELCAYTEFSSVQSFIARGPRDHLCEPCFASGSRAFAPLPIPMRRYREFATDEQIESFREETITWSLDRCFAFAPDGLALGEQTRAATIRFFGKADLTSEPPDDVVSTARRFAAGALVAAAVAESALHELEPEVVVCHHGVYVPQGVLGEVARARGVRVVNWGPTYRDRTVIYSHGDTYHRTLVDEPAEAWDTPLGDADERELLRFLAERRRGKGDWSWVTPEAALRPNEQEAHDLVEELGLDPSRETYGLLTNVLWDAQLYYEGHGFAHMLEWLWTTIDHFAQRPDRQLIIRIHPHEVKAGNRQPVGAEIARRYPKLPSNVFVVPHDSPLNTYALMALCRAVLIYGTKTGVELAPLGQPVVVAADAWIRDKGLTTDARTREEYVRILDRLSGLEPLDHVTTDRARRYAYHYFFRRMIPLTSLVEGASDVTLAVESLDELLPGRDRGLDVVCNGILNGTAFTFDA